MGRCELTWEGRLEVIEQATGETGVVGRLAGVHASNDASRASAAHAVLRWLRPYTYKGASETGSRQIITNGINVLLINFIYIKRPLYAC